LSEVSWTRTTVGGPNDLGGSVTENTATAPSYLSRQDRSLSVVRVNLHDAWKVAGALVRGYGPQGQLDCVSVPLLLRQAAHYHGRDSVRRQLRYEPAPWTHLNLRYA
jgi:hypothetical protein